MFLYHQVTKSPAPSNSSHAAWQVTFLTYGGNLDPLVVVSPVGTTNSAYPKKSCLAYQCMPFSNRVVISNITVTKLQNGTIPISGVFRLGVSRYATKDAC